MPFPRRRSISLRFQVAAGAQRIEPNCTCQLLGQCQSELLVRVRSVAEEKICAAVPFKSHRMNSTKQSWPRESDSVLEWTSEKALLQPIEELSEFCNHMAESAHCGDCRSKEHMDLHIVRVCGRAAGKGSKISKTNNEHISSKYPLHFCYI
jgi:hypothetical protein